MTEYEVLLKKDLWDDGEFIGLIIKGFKPDDGKPISEIELLDLIVRSVEAGTLKHHGKPYGKRYDHTMRRTIYRFAPVSLIQWAIAKKIQLPHELLEWYDQQNKPPPESVELPESLAKLNEGYVKFWANADPLEKDTHPKNQEVTDWLIKQGFSGISAKQGATLIRPEWAAKGNY
jgi:hypothetical protein